MPNPVTHFEVHGRDAAKSQEFYASLFGWTVDANNPVNYGMVTTGSDKGISGGIAGAMGNPMVTFYVEVDDLEATLQKAEAQGAKRVMARRMCPAVRASLCSRTPTATSSG